MDVPDDVRISPQLREYFSGLSEAELERLDGLLAAAAEINVLDGVTAEVDRMLTQVKSDETGAEQPAPVSLSKEAK
jgi:hypothetical protein